MNLSATLVVFFLCLASPFNPALGNEYPEHWWAPVIDSNIPDWEITPDKGEKGKTLILSKRNELGILSNFAPTPFELDGKTYLSIEGLWQSMKYPENAQDPRFDPRVSWAYTREQVEQMSAFEAKAAGDLASQNMKIMGINWVSYLGETFTYRTSEKGRHYQIILAAMRAKLEQNPEVQAILGKTKGLQLLPDHITKSEDPPAWKYFAIWMHIRD